MGEEALAILRQGAYFGEMSLIDDSCTSSRALIEETPGRRADALVG